MSYNYGFEEGLYNNKGVFDDMSIRKGFIRKVYSLLSIQLIFTTILTSLFVLNDSVKSFGQSDTGQGLLVLSIVTMLATLIAPLCCCMDAYDLVTFCFLFSSKINIASDRQTTTTTTTTTTTYHLLPNTTTTATATTTTLKL